jgi:hypothetical protein
MCSKRSKEKKHISLNTSYKSLQKIAKRMLIDYDFFIEKLTQRLCVIAKVIHVMD